MQHKVISNILARKGKPAPFDDGRKIGLVLLGGVMAGVNGAGAVTALEQLGLTNAFDTIYCASAGFCNASYFLAEKAEYGSTIYYENLSGSQFIRPWKFWKPLLFDWVIEVVKNVKPIDTKKIWGSNTDIVLRLRDFQSMRKNRVYVSLKDYKESEYFDVLKAAISFPFLTKCAELDMRKLCDGQTTNWDTIDHLRYVLLSNCTDLLIIYSHKHQQHFTIQKSDRICEIIPDGVSDIGIFETRPDVLKNAHQGMVEHVLNVFKI